MNLSKYEFNHRHGLYLTNNGVTRPEIDEMRRISEKWNMRGALGYVECVVSQGVSGTLFNTYTTAKTVIPPTSLWTMPPNYLYVGRKMRFRIHGGLSNIVTTPGLFNVQVKFGSVAAFDTGNIQLNATAHTTLPFFLEIALTCQVIGSTTTAKMIGFGDIAALGITRTAGQTDNVQGIQSLMVPQTAPAQGTGFDSTISNVVDLWAGFTISNAGNGIQIHEYSLEILN